MSGGAFTRAFQKAAHRCRATSSQLVTSAIRKPWWRLQGMAIGTGTTLTTLTVNWPHKVRIGRDCTLEPDLFIKFDGVWSPGVAIVIGDRTFLGRGTEFNIIDSVEIGCDSLIGSNCRFVDHDHGMAPGRLMGPQPPTRSPILLGAGVWLGAGVTVLQGVSIGDGAVVAAGAVVTRAVPANEIWGGIPARRLSSRDAGASESRA